MSFKKSQTLTSQQSLYQDYYVCHTFEISLLVSKKKKKTCKKRAYINLQPIRITSTKYKITRNRLKIIEKADAVVLEHLIVKLWILHITEQMRQFSQPGDFCAKLSVLDFLNIRFVSLFCLFVPLQLMSFCLFNQVLLLLKRFSFAFFHSCDLLIIALFSTKLQIRSDP